MKNIITLIASVMLLVAIPSGIWPYSYYQLLRWVIFGVGIYLAYMAGEKENNIWMLIMGIAVIVFNPFSPFYLDKGVWIFIDLIYSILFLISIKEIKP